MTIFDSIRDELHRECEEIKKLIYEILFDFKETSTQEQLVKDFGLTEDEAKAWLES